MLLALKDQEVEKVYQETKELLVHMDHKVQEESQDQLVPKEIMDLKAQKETKVKEEKWETKDIEEMPDQLERKDLRV